MKRLAIGSAIVLAAAVAWAQGAEILRVLYLQVRCKPGNASTPEADHTNLFCLSSDDLLREIDSTGTVRILHGSASGAFVASVADGTGIDGTASGAGSTYTPTLDLTEISSATLGAGAFTTLTFDAGATDPILRSISPGTFQIEAGGTSPIFNLDDQGDLRFLEEDGGGSNFVAFKAPAAITSDVTCTFENDANPIPDSCVGDGVDASGAGGNSWTTINTPSGTDPTATSSGETVDFTTTSPLVITGTQNAAPTADVVAFSWSGFFADAQIDGSLEADELVLAGDVDGAANSNDIDEVAVEAELESVIDLLDLQDDAAAGTCSASQQIRRNGTDTGFECFTPGASSVNVVEAEVNFGATGAYDATTTITGQAWVSGTSKIICSPTMFSTADRPDGSDDALLDELDVSAYARVAATGFTVKAHAPQRAFGRFIVHCTGA